MSDDDLIRRGDALQLVEEYETIHDRISLLPAALPARGVGVRPRIVPLHTQSLYGVCIGGRWDGWVMVKHPDGHWVSHNKPDAIDPMGDVIAALSPALAPTDAAQAREAAQVIAKNGAEATAAAMILHIAETLREKGKAVLTTGDDFGAQVLQYADALALIGEPRT